MSLSGEEKKRGTTRFPRASGDEPVGSLLYSAGVKFSPRERG